VTKISPTLITSLESAQADCRADDRNAGKPHQDSGGGAYGLECPGIKLPMKPPPLCKSKLRNPDSFISVF
jgi:hypothetical protein